MKVAATAAALTSTVLATAACSSARAPAAQSSSRAARVTLAVLPAESDQFPRAAQALTDSLRTASVSGVDRTEVSKVSLEVVQLSIECVEPTTDCYAKVGRSLAANRLLFAELARGAKKKQVKVTVTFFDVDTQAPKIAEKVFANEQEATAGVAALVTEATR